MSKTEKKKRNQKTILLDDNDLAIITYIQSTHNLSFNAAVKFLIRRNKIKQYVADDKIAQVIMLHMLGQLKVQLSDVAFLDCKNCALQLEKIYDLLVQVRNAIFRRLGRKR